MRRRLGPTALSRSHGADPLPSSLSVCRSLADQRWHTDGRGRDETEALTVFFPLCDFTSTNGPTQFILGSHKRVAEGDNDDADDDNRAARATTLLLPAGAAVAFDYRLWHRGLRNQSGADRPVLYAIIGRPVFTSDGFKGLPDLDRGSSFSIFGGGEVAATPPFPLGAPVDGAAEEDIGRCEAASRTRKRQLSRANGSGTTTGARRSPRLACHG